MHLQPTAELVTRFPGESDRRVAQENSEPMIERIEK
jgi:hypothetical protein